MKKNELMQKLESYPEAGARSCRAAAEGRNVLPRPLHIDDGKIHLFLLSAPEPNSIGRLEIVNRFHDIDHIHRIANHIDDVCERFVRHRRFVDRRGLTEVV